MQGARRPGTRQTTTAEKGLASTKDYYRILGVDEHADQVAIKRAYRRLALQYHPDVARSRHASTRFLEIQEAYAILSDPERRRQYDGIRHTSSQETASASARRPRAQRASARPRSRLFQLLLEVPGLLNVGVSVGRFGWSVDRGRTAGGVSARPAAGRRTKSRRRLG